MISAKDTEEDQGSKAISAQLTKEKPKQYIKLPSVDNSTIFDTVFEHIPHPDVTNVNIKMV